MPNAERLERLRRELQTAREGLSHLGYYEQFAPETLTDVEKENLAEVRDEVARLEQAVAEAEGQALTGDGSGRP